MAGVDRGAQECSGKRKKRFTVRRGEARRETGPARLKHCYFPNFSSKQSSQL